VCVCLCVCVRFISENGRWNYGFMTGKMVKPKYLGSHTETNPVKRKARKEESENESTGRRVEERENQILMCRTSKRESGVSRKRESGVFESDHLFFTNLSTHW